MRILSLTLIAASLSFSLAAPAFADDAMMKHNSMMKHDSMKHDSMMKHDKMKHDSMMKHESMMKKDDEAK
jgi:pentapeptide MXKDX repeat protein